MSKQPHDHTETFITSLQSLTPEAASQMWAERECMRPFLHLAHWQHDDDGNFTLQPTKE